MPTVYVTEPGAQVHKSADCLVIQKEKKVLDEIPLIKIDQLVVIGQSIGISTPALFALAGRGVEVIYLTGRGKFISRMVGEGHKNIQLRHRQNVVLDDAGTRTPLAAAIVRGKIHNQRVLIQRALEQAPWGAVALAVMDDMAKKIDLACNLEALRGLEGNAAREYFSIFRRLLRRPPDGEDWGFQRRAYYPPPDPINALLSFGYSLLLKDVQAACQQAGLDPYIGCFHVLDYGRPSMALDLMEEFRPVIVDSLVLQAVNRDLIRLGDFETRQAEEEDLTANLPYKGLWMKADARNRFIESYEVRVNQPVLFSVNGNQETYRRIFMLQAQQMARVIMDEEKAYQPYQIR